MSQGYTKGTPIDTDPALSANSDLVTPSQAAVVSYVASQIPLAGVTAVSGAAPINVTPGPTPTVSMPVASAVQNGYLSTADWSTFNNKQSALTFSTGLTDTAGTITANLSTGISGGQSVIGGTAASNNLTLSSTSNATKGKILFGTSAYDEVNDRLGIGTASPGYRFHLVSSLTASSGSAISSYIDTTLTAAANNDFLVATNINATFSLGAFTGTSSYLQRWQTAGITRSFIRSLGNQTWNLATTVVEAGQIEYSTPSGNAGIIIWDWDTVNSTYINRYNIANQGTYFYQGFHSINTLGGMALFNTTHNLILGYTGTPSDAGYKLDVNGTTRTQGDFTISDAKNIILGTTTGTKIGTATSQKLSFWNATPIVQPTTAVAAATRVGGGGTTITATDTFDGYTLQQVVKALRNAGLLA